MRVIYVWLHIKTGRVYIGQSGNHNRRKQQHLSNLQAGIHHNTFFQRAWSKYGSAEYDYYVLDEFDSLAQCNEAEQLYITWFKALGLAYNHRGGGDALGTHDEATRQKLSSIKGRKGNTLPRSAETRAQISASLTGRKLGPRSEETKRKISAANTGRKLSDDHRRHMSEARSGEVRGPLSAETRSKISAVHKGKPKSSEHRAKMSAFRTGRTTTEETKRKQSESAKGHIKSEEHRANLSASLTGRKLSEEARRNLSAAHIGKQTGPRPQWVRDKISAGHKARLSKV